MRRGVLAATAALVVALGCGERGSPHATCEDAARNLARLHVGEVGDLLDACATQPRPFVDCVARARDADALAGCDVLRSPGDACDVLAARNQAQARANVRANLPPELAPAVEERLTAVRAVLARRCKADRWPARVVDCARTADDVVSDCLPELPSRAQQALLHDLEGAAADAGVAPAYR